MTLVQKGFQTSTAESNHKPEHSDRALSGALKFERDLDGDYYAEAHGVTYVIVKSTNAGFGLSLRIPKHLEHVVKGEQIAWRIYWLRTKRRCEEWANKYARLFAASQTGGGQP